jgi:hypothetical protein
MISNKNVINYKVVDIIEIYNFGFGAFSMWFCLNNSKFEFQNMRISNRNFEIENEFKWKSCQ